MCGKTRGKYIGESIIFPEDTAIFEGEYAFPIGINNHSFKAALRKRLDLGDRPVGCYGHEFEAFVYVDGDEVFTRVYE